MGLTYCGHALAASFGGWFGFSVLKRTFIAAGSGGGSRTLRSRIAAALGVARRREYSIAIWGGEHPCELHPSAARRPVLTRRDVRDVPAAYVADPFIVRHEATWFMFFEVLRSDTGRGELAVARSDDLVRWAYLGVVLRDAVHLSYPHVFLHDGVAFMVPETSEAGEVRLYRASSFPDAWEPVGTLVAGAPFVDASLLLHEGHWYMFAGTVPDAEYDGSDLRLFHSGHLEGPWIEHPASPIVQGDRRLARPAGRVVVHNGGLLRFVQDGATKYGERVFAITIDVLNPMTYRERPYGPQPVIGPGTLGWNSGGMHHVDAHFVDGRWVAAVDGWTYRLRRATQVRR